MKPNVGSLDRALRITIGLLLVVLAGLGVIGLWGWLGLIPLATGLVRICPAYSVLGVDTTEVKSS